MTEFDPAIHTEEYFAKRSVPAIITYLNPFRIVERPDLPPWEIDINQVNWGGWDYAALHEMVGGLDVGLPTPYHLVVTRDGALALPPIEQLDDDQKSVEFFNRCLAALLVGGIYCEAISLDGLEFGHIFDWKYVRSQTKGLAAPNRLHSQFRRGHGWPQDTISLLSPRTIQFSELNESMVIGRAILSSIPEVSGEFLLKGATGFARRDWGSALANLWIVVEQITSHLWNAHVLQPNKGISGIPGRSKQLEDFRTWTTSVRLEVLFQIGVLTAETLAALSAARKARNDLSHNGHHPSAAAARAAWKGVIGLFETSVPDKSIPLKTLDIENHTLSDPFEPREPLQVEPKFWMEIPKLPGEKEFELLSAAFRANKERK